MTSLGPAAFLVFHLQMFATVQQFLLAPVLWSCWLMCVGVPHPLDETFGRSHLGLSDSERIVGLVHLGSRGDTPPERPRPDVAAKTSWPE